jgi:hypothetical protein
MPTRAELDAMPIKELHDLAMETARRHVDVGFLWEIVKALPVAEEVTGDDQRSKVDIVRPLALINDFLYDSDSGAVGEALRPLYVDYLLGKGE